MVSSSNFWLSFSRLFEKVKQNLNLNHRKTTPEKDSSAIARVVREVAETGIGTDACLELGCLPMLVNFYSPVPDIKDLGQRQVWAHRSDLTGIDFDIENQVKFLTRLGKEYGRECKWPRTPTKTPNEFYTDNGCFSFGCAASLHSVLRSFKPKHVIEIGSGNSSLVISKALSLNAGDSSEVNSEYTIVDPYPRDIITKDCLRGVSQIIKKRAELMDLSLFDQLEENDVLFIDSSHTVRTGGDVNFLILEVLPRLKPGVIVHFHDIHLPYEYHETYFTNPKFRVFWTEAYLLQAFLSCNAEYEILMAMNYLMVERLDDFCAAFPYFDLENNWANSGSFWIRRKLN